MRSIYLCCTTILLVCIGSTIPARAQSTSSRAGSFHAVEFPVRTPYDTTFTLPDQFIVQGSETIMLDSIHLMPSFSGKDGSASGGHYSIVPRFGIITLRSDSMQKFLQGTSKHTLRVRYQSLPFSFKKSYKHREPVVKIDTATGQAVTVAKPSPAFSLDDLFGSNLQKSGSIVRGVTIGSNRDLSLNSGFRMQMSGNLTNDLQLIAALTDENTPIQPEGSTQTLSEVDKVFVELRGNDLSATLGDFNLSLDGNEFGTLNRKLQGARGIANYRVGEGTNGTAMISGAITRGKFTTNQFGGLDGVQGPYQLIGPNNNRTIVVVAGSERVYINGERMTRGDNNDYTIDYATAEVTFTPHRLISSGTRIVVDFEFSDRHFSRSLVAANVGTNLFNDEWTLNATFLRESDNENAPLDISLSDQDKLVLSNAGSDQFKAARSGVQYAGAGHGQYRKLDTLLAIGPGRDSVATVYVYAPEDTLNAVYSLSFAYVGSGKGDYRKISLDYYEFAGLGQGSYRPIYYLPMPQSQSLTDFDLRGQVTENLKVTGEGAFSNNNSNRFSTLSGTTKNGTALKLGAQFSPKDVHIGSTNIGSFDINLKERYVGAQFAPLDRVNDVEFNRTWNIQNPESAREEIREGTVGYQPIQSLTFTAGLGWMKRGDPFSSSRYTFAGRFTGELQPIADYTIEQINSRNSILGVSGRWTRQHGLVRHEFGIFTPKIGFTNELLYNRSILNDILQQGSYRLNEVIPGVTVAPNDLLVLGADVGWRWDDSLANESIHRAANTSMQHFSGQLREWHSLSSSLDLTMLNRTFTETFRRANNADNNTLLLRWQTRYNPFEHGIESDWFYEVATERSAKMDRVFQRVPTGTGNYIYLGDVNGNHVVDQQDFRLTRFDGDFVAVAVPTDELVPIIDVRASTRVRLNPQKIFLSDAGLAKALSILSSETYLRVEEKNSERDTRQIYLLHFSRFLNDQTTIAGSNLFTQDVYILEDNLEFSLRFRYSQRNGLTQFALSNERTYARERSVRLRWQLVKEIANEIDFINRNDDLTATQWSSRVRGVSSNALTMDWSYRPEQKIELGFKFGVGRATNFDTTNADLNDQLVRLIYSFENRGQAKFEFSREEVVFTRAGGTAPFELTDGRLLGRTWLWRLGFDYRVTQFLQATMSYDGRSEGGRVPVHTGRAEVRAFF